MEKRLGTGLRRRLGRADRSAEGRFRENPVFRPLNYVELLMYTDLQPENGYAWVNTACAEYYGKESVTVVAGMAGE